MRSGPDEYGNPCRECNFSWETAPSIRDARHHETHEILDAFVLHENLDTRAPKLQWSIREYLCHIADNEQIWATRFTQPVPYPTTNVIITPYDQDELAKNNGYDQIPTQKIAARLHTARNKLLFAIKNLDDALNFYHPERGTLTAPQAIDLVMHDTYHHLNDIQYILTAR